MSIFSSKTKINVDAVTQSIIEEKQDFIKQGVLAGTLGGGGPANGIRSQITSGFSSNVDTFYRIAKRNPLITLPQGYSTRDSADTTEIRKLIEEDLQVSVLVREAFVSGVLADCFGLYYIQETYGINHQDNKLKTLINNEGLSQVFLNAEYLTESLLKINYEISFELSKQIKSIEIDFPVNQDSIYYYAYYVKNKNELLFWFQEIKNSFFDVTTRLQEIEYLPVLFVKENNVTILEESNKDKLDAYEKACKPLGFSFKDMATSILTPSEDNDPEQMRDIFFQFAADIHTKDKHTNFYLFEYFNFLRSTQRTEKAEYLKWAEVSPLRSGIFNPPTNIVRVSEGNYDANLLFNYIELSFETDTDDLKFNEIKKEFIVRNPMNAQQSVLGLKIELDKLEQSEMVLKKKINSTQVAVLKIHGLTHVHVILKDKLVVRTIANSLDLANVENDDKSFFIPLCMSTLKKLSPLTRSYIYQETMSVTIYAEVRTKVKWYERGAFKIVLAVVMIVIFIYTGYIDISSFAAFFSSLAVLVGTQLLIELVLLPILIKAVEIIGVDAATVIATILTVAAIMTGNAATAAQFLEMARWTYQAVAEVSMNIIESLAEELNKLFDAFKEFQDELDAISDLLGSGKNDYLLNSIKGTYFDPNETPDMFFYRSIHDTNPGIKVFEFVEKYVPLKLELPKVKHEFKDTQLGGE